MRVSDFEICRGAIPERFATDLEGAFQVSHYLNVRNTIRLTTLLLTLLALLYASRDFLETHSLLYVARFTAPEISLFLFVLGLSFVRGFERLWQPVLVVGGWWAAAGAMNALITFLAGPERGGLPVPTLPPSADSHLLFNLFFTLQACILMVCLANFRLTFSWALLLQTGVAGIGVWQLALRLTPAEAGADISRYLQFVLLVLFAVLLSAYLQERLARESFLAHHILHDARNHERSRREQTEQMLRVLGRAIGGIVHDLGNPLTVVQTGASILGCLLEEGQIEPRKAVEITEHIRGGTQMLNYLRLSLIEQTRVLEGRPTPVDRKLVPLRRLAEAGARYQKSQLTVRRTITIEGDDVEVFVDEPKMVTVLMNLIANALKYSDGDVLVRWRLDLSENTLFLAVLDRGKEGIGLTRAQAARLFTAFGRLESHAEIEGTGLGLLSVRSIVEAHGGEAYIEGLTADGNTPNSARFTTAARRSLPSLLPPGYKTAFVVTCPYTA